MRIISKINFLILFMLVFSISSHCLANIHHDKNYNVKLQILNNSGSKIEFWVKIAKTPEERKNGLMFVEHLAENNGMVFEMGSEQVVTMWMKNTKIPLDMIFINKNNQISLIKHNATPNSLDIISSGNKVIKVLEIGGGVASKLGIKEGDYIKYDQNN